MTLPKFTIVVLSVFCVHWISFCVADSSEYVDFRASPPTEYGPSSSLSPAVTSFSSPSSSSKPKNYHYNSYGRDNKGVYVDERRPRHHMIPFTPSFILRTPSEPTAKPKLESHFEPYEAFDFNFNNRPRSRARRPHHFNNRKRPSHGHKKPPPPKRFPPSHAKEASTDDPIIFSFKVDRRSWSQNYKVRLASLQHKISSLEEMEDYAKPSTMQLGYKLWNWVKGFGSKKDSGSSSSTTLEKLEEPDKGSKYDKYENPTYYSHSVSSTEIIRGGRDRNRFKNLPIPPVAFNSLRGHDHDHHPRHNPHHHHHHHHHHGDEDSYRHDPYLHSKESDLPLSADVHDDFHSSKETRHNKNPQCSKGGSMIFCNSAALTGLLELLEAHMGKTTKYDDSYYNKDNPSYTGTPYDEIGEPPIIEVIEMDPQEEHRDFDQFPDTEKYTYTKNGAVDFGYDSYNKGTGGYDDDGQIEIVIVVHTKKPSYGKDNNNYNYDQYGLGHGGGSSGWHSKTKPTYDKYKKPFRNVDDDEDLNEYDKKFDRLKKIVDIIRYKHNRDGEFKGDEYYYDDSNHKKWKGKLKYSRGNKDDDGYWDSLLEEFRLRHGYDFVPYSSKYSKMTSRKGASTSIENQMLGMGLVIDMKDHGRGNSLADRLMMGSRMGKTEEKYFGLSRAGKSKHASAEERMKAIRAKLAQVHP